MYIAVKGTVIVAEFQNDRLKPGRDSFHRMPPPPKKAETSFKQGTQPHSQINLAANWNCPQK